LTAALHLRQLAAQVRGGVVWRGPEELLRMVDVLGADLGDVGQQLDRVRVKKGEG